MEKIATACFALAIFHTFATSYFKNLSHKYPEDSFRANLLHFLAEVEVVFGIWACVLITIWSLRFSTKEAAHYLDTINYTEALFVFVVMTIAATRPILEGAFLLSNSLASLIPLPTRPSRYATALIAGPLLGSLITEPAAMTVTALLLKDEFFAKTRSPKFRYATLGLLFVNISVGGTLTHFAAPPVLMVAGPWGWDTPFMFSHFGWKAVIIVTISTLMTTTFFWQELTSTSVTPPSYSSRVKLPWGLTAVHLAFLAVTVLTAHHPAFFIGLFLLFLGWCSVTKRHQSELKIKESLLVGYFLAGLVTLGNLQAWWLKPLLSNMDELTIFFGATSLTALTDNAALTYLGTLVEGLSPEARYGLVAGAVTGGGLTVIANAPNPAGYGLVRSTFPNESIHPLGLCLGALPYTLLAGLIFLAL